MPYRIKIIMHTLCLCIACVLLWFKKPLEVYRTRTNFRGTYISRMPQIQHFRDFIFEDHRILYR